MLIELSDGSVIKFLPMTLSQREEFLPAYARMLGHFDYCLGLLPEASLDDICELHAGMADALGSLRKFLPASGKAYALADLQAMFLPSEHSRIGLFLQANAIAGDNVMAICESRIESWLKQAADAIEADVYLGLEKALTEAKTVYGYTANKRSNYSHTDSGNETDFGGLELDSDKPAEPADFDFFADNNQH